MQVWSSDFSTPDCRKSLNLRPESETASSKPQSVKSSCPDFQCIHLSHVLLIELLESTKDILQHLRRVLGQQWFCLKSHPLG